MAERSKRRTLPGAVAFWILAGMFLILFFASAAASPLYGVYQAQFHFSAATLTAVFAVYVLVLLVTLLICGSLSDYLGRIPVIITALVFSVAACVVFLIARDTGALYGARALQGVATGLASGPIGAALIDLQPQGTQRAPLVTSAFSTLGLALGSLITSVLVQYAPAPTHLIWWALLAVCAVSIVTMGFVAEPGSRRPGVLASLRPRVVIPRQARGAYFGVLPALLAIWALGGLFGAIATTTSAILFVGAAVAGIGFGLVNLGSFRLITARATPDQRGGLVAAIYLAGYLAFSIPALIAGVTTTKYGLHSTALVYAAALGVLAAAAAGIMLLRPDRSGELVPRPGRLSPVWGR
jgi:MFS family permease